MMKNIHLRTQEKTRKVKGRKETFIIKKYENIAPRASFWIMWHVIFEQKCITVNLKLLLARFTFLLYIFPHSFTYKTQILLPPFFFIFA